MKISLILICCAGLLSSALLVAVSKKEPANKKLVTLKVGDTAPNFTLPNEKGEMVTLHSVPGKKAVYFYPMDATPGCTKQACSLRDGHTELKEKGVTVLGISADSVNSHKKFTEKHHLPFTLLSDAKSEVIKLYGTAGTFFNSRITFLVDEKNKIVKVLKNIKTKDHANQILKEFGFATESQK